MIARIAWLAALAAALAGSPAAQGPTVTTLLNNGPTNNRYDMVILGDGYTAAEQTTFNNDCMRFLASLSAKEPYATFSQYINLHTVFRPSLSSGANHPDLTPPVYNNPVYGASYNTGGTARCLYITNTSLAMQDAALAPANEGRIMVLVNDSRYGGCASTFAVSYNGSSMGEVQVHEIGHSIGSLADEYDYPNQTYNGPEPSQVNITRSSTGQKWSHWWGYNGVSAFQGAGYYLYGLYRPRSNCLMRSLGQPHCAVCSEQITRVLNTTVNVIENPQPPAGPVVMTRPNQQTFTFTSLVPQGNGATIVWELDNVVLAGVTGTSCTLDTNAMSLGNHTLEVTVNDLSPMVRNDPNATMTSTRTWNVSVTDPTACDLQVTTVQGSSLWVTSGNSYQFAVDVINHGPAASPQNQVELFLSTDLVVQTTDIYLGSLALPALNANQTTQIVFTATMPALLLNPNYYVLAFVDRGNTANEVNEGNNQGTSVILIQPGFCTPTLEFRDDLLYPRDQATLPFTGGTLLPTVVARCAPTGTSYLIACGISGTVPGGTYNGVHVPLNADPITSLGLSTANGPVFQAFWMPLDAQGVGRATLQLPPLPASSALQAHLAAVLLDPSLNVLAATNAVSITIQ